MDMTPNLPSEILSQILNEVLISDGRQTFVQLLQVCNSWKTIAERSLYQNVAITSSYTLEDFKDRLLSSSTDATQSPVGHLVITLRIEIHGMNQDLDRIDHWHLPVRNNLFYDTSMATTCILLHTPNLRSYQNITSGQLVQVATMARLIPHVLKILRIAVRRCENNLFTIINSFSGLRTLDINILNKCVDGSLSSWTHELKNPLILPKTSLLILRIRGGIDQPVAEFLAHCRFGRHCEVRSWISDYSWLHESIVALQSFVPFFHINETIARLYLIGLPAKAQAVLAHEIARVPTVHFKGSFPALELFRQDVLPRKVTFELPNLKHDSKEVLDFWKLIRELLHRVRNHSTSKPCIIQVGRDGNEVISWIDEDREEDEEAFLQELLPLVQELHESKVHITDYEGYDCTWMQPRVVGSDDDVNLRQEPETVSDA